MTWLKLVHHYGSSINNMVGITESNLTDPLLWDVNNLLLRDVDALQRGDANMTHHVLPSFYRPKHGYIIDKTVQTPHQTKCHFVCIFVREIWLSEVRGRIYLVS